MSRGRFVFGLCFFSGCFTGGSSAMAQSHRGSLGLFVEGHGVSRSLGLARNQIENSWGVGPELGLSVATDDDGNEVKASVRFLEGATAREWEAFLARRSYFGDEQAKTFLDVGLVIQWAPIWTVGPRVGLGFQYDWTPVLGTYAGLGIQVGLGGESRLVTGLHLGIQLRSYFFQ